MGRKTKLTPELTRNICDRVRMGLPYRSVAELNGISEPTFYDWINRGEEAQSGLFFEFAKEVKKAKREGEAVLLARIQTAAREEWTAAAWILERRHPEDYVRRTESVVSGPGGGPIETVLRTIEQAYEEAEEE